jgi:poly(glycerol-phosphate) alpha-glucosyltransferase
MFHLWAVALSARLRGGRYAITPHGMLTPWILARSPRLKWIVNRLFQRRAFAHATAVQALTRAEADEIAAYIGTAPTPRIEVIGNFVPEAGAPGQTPCCPSFAGRRVFLFLGRIHQKKGWRELCDAWDTLCSDDPGLARRIGLVFAGWLDDCPQFEPRIAALTASHRNVIWAGPVFGQDKQAAFDTADVFVLPSHSEGLPMAVLEAWGAGLPALITPGCNLPDGIEAGAALECKPEAGSIEAALRQFATMPTEDFARMQEAARALVEQNYREGVVMDKIVHDLLQLEGGPR